jgi:hypothetical protein
MQNWRVAVSYGSLANMPQASSENLELNAATFRRLYPGRKYHFEPTSPFGYVMLVFIELAAVT